MKQEDLSPEDQNLAIGHCRALTADDAGADPSAQQRAALNLLAILDSDDTQLRHFESGEQFSVTFYIGLATHGVEGAVILQGIDKPPVGVVVQHVGRAAAPTGHMARMGAEGEVADIGEARTGGQIADEIDPDRTKTEALCTDAELDEDGSVADPAAYEPAPDLAPGEARGSDEA